MIYVYDAELLADLRNRSLWYFNEYNLLSLITKKPWILKGFFYFFTHEVYDPVFLWNFPEQSQLNIEHGNNRFIGRSLKSQIIGERWIYTKLSSPVTWDYKLSDLKVKSLDKILYLEFPLYKDFVDNPHLSIIKSDLYKKIIEPCLRSPTMSKKLFRSETDNMYAIFLKDKLKSQFVLKINDSVSISLGDENDPINNVYEVKQYGGIIPALVKMFSDAEKEIS